ncbi:Uncharacterised protein [Mycobacterium tuberculosis]|nr:Uncharacterised protein [Mycobacterium tuberculosis]
MSGAVGDQLGAWMVVVHMPFQDDSHVFGYAGAN